MLIKKVDSKIYVIFYRTVGRQREVYLTVIRVEKRKKKKKKRKRSDT